MNCPECDTLNPKEAKFCFNCGAKLALLCPRCATENPFSARFCFNCGHRFARPQEEGRDPLPPAHRLIPPALAYKLKAAHRNQTMQGERRIVTMLFSDLVDSTRASEHLDPEEWTGIINGVFEHMIMPVYKYEGNVARLMGDAILAFFGAPIAHEDDPQRAVLAGLDIVEGIRSYREEVKRQWSIDLNVRVGINTGLVVVGAVGSDLRLEYTAMGNAINLAARMEQSAAPGTVQIAEGTYQQVRPFFETKDLGDIAIKGRSQPVKAYQVLGQKTTPGRLRGIEGLDAPLIGRDQEKSLLQRAIADLHIGLGGIIFLIGQAGLGKSRLLSELWSNGAQWVESTSLSYETNQPYSLFQRLLRRFVGASAADPPERLRAAIGNLIQSFHADEQEDNRRVFEALFGLASQSGQPPLEGEAFKERLFATMTALWQVQMAKGPVILVFDDLHWSDPGSVTLLQYLLPLTEQGPLLILCAMRPDTQSDGWAVKELAERDFRHRYTEVRLHALNPEESNALVNSLLRITELPPSLQKRILDKTEGNPFFVEEVVRTFIDSGIVIQDESGVRWQASVDGQEFDIPDNVRTLLTTRIDRLDSETRSTLQLASVIGRSFSRRLLAEIDDEVDDHLLTLRRAQFIREVARIPEIEYAFRHALTQEAAYSTILHRQRRLYHQRVGEALESLFPEQREELAATLAYHFEHAEILDKALVYLKQAGARAARLSANIEAVDYLRRGLTLLKTQPNTPERTQQELDFQTTLGPILMLIKGYTDPEVERVYDRARELYQQLKESPHHFHMLYGMWTFYLLRADSHVIQELASQIRQLAESTQEATLLVEAYRVMGITLYFSGNFTSALGIMEQGIALYDPEEHHSPGLFVTDPGVNLLTWSSLILWFSGYPERSARRVNEMLALAQRLSHAPTLALAHAFAAISHQLRREGQIARKHAEEAISFKISTYVAIGAMLRGWALAEQGQLQDGQALLTRALAGYRTSGASFGEPYFLALLVEIYRNTGQYGQALQTLEEAFSAMSKHGERWPEAELLRLKGEILLMHDATKCEAEEYFHKAVQVAQGQLARLLELRATVSLSRLWREQGRDREARQKLAEIYGWFSDGFDTADLQDAKALLEELS